MHVNRYYEYNIYLCNAFCFVNGDIVYKLIYSMYADLYIDRNICSTTINQNIASVDCIASILESGF